MNDLRTRLQGLWLPLITPLRDGEIDEASLRRLVRHYAYGPVDGLILAATSGEGLLLSAGEQERLVNLVRRALDDAGRYLPICLGLAGASTATVLDTIDETAGWPIDGYLISSPYYLRPCNVACGSILPHAIERVDKEVRNGEAIEKHQSDGMSET